MKYQYNRLIPPLPISWNRLLLIHTICKQFVLVAAILYQENIFNANDMKLKSRMTVGEMSEHLTEHTGKFANRVSVGRYAKKLGYAVYKPMINGRICQFYVNPSIKDDGEAETLRTNERENGHERE